MSGRSMTVTWLNLKAFGIYRDVRKLIYMRLDPFDFAMVEAAHFSQREVKLDESLRATVQRSPCARHTCIISSLLGTGWSSGNEAHNHLLSSCWHARAIRSPSPMSWVMKNNGALCVA